MLTWHSGVHIKRHEKIHGTYSLFDGDMIIGLGEYVVIAKWKVHMTDAKQSRNHVRQKSHARFCSRADEDNSADSCNQFIKDPKSIPPEFLKIPEVNEAMVELQFVRQDKAAREEYIARQREQ